MKAPEIHRRLLADNLGDDRLALEHASHVIEYLASLVPFGLVRGLNAYPRPSVVAKPRVEPVLLESERG